MYFSGCPIKMGPVVKSLNGKNELISNTSRNATLDPLDSDSVISSIWLHGFGLQEISIMTLFSFGVNGISKG